MWEISSPWGKFKYSKIDKSVDSDLIRCIIQMF